MKLKAKSDAINYTLENYKTKGKFDLAYPRFCAYFLKWGSFVLKVVTKKVRDSSED